MKEECKREENFFKIKAGEKKIPFVAHSKMIIIIFCGLNRKCCIKTEFVRIFEERETP